MFWNKKPKSPITPEDEEWLRQAIDWFERSFGKDISQQEIFLPTKSFIGFDYKHTEEDVYRLFDLVAEKMKIEDSAVFEVHFFTESGPMAFSDEGAYTNFEEGEKTTLGDYNKIIDGIYQIGIDRSLIHRPVDLIGTIAHELAHVKLLGGDLLEENDEPLTDITASLFGFMVFISHGTVSRFSAWTGSSHQGWQLSGTAGYLHYKLHAFVAALLMERLDDEAPEWLDYLDKEIVSEAAKATKYLRSLKG